MFFTYLRRELRRRRRRRSSSPPGLALGIALVIVVNSVSSGMSRAQGKVLESLYGIGTDLTVTKAQERPEAGAQPCSGPGSSSRARRTARSRAATG
ncbi:hypothetical protein STANM309S_02004 [Streptomyces tanashiensis]